jgi:SAM-dependent methyltransferase
MVHHDVCPLCSGRIVPEYTCTDFFVTGEQFTLFRCTECGFLLTQDHPSESEAGRYYESDEYISHSDTSKGLINKAYRLARDLMLKSKRSLVKKATGLKKGNLIDIGSGTGYFADEMNRSGWRVKGIEINEKARAFASDHFGLEVLSPSMIDHIEKTSADCITLWHVLEHFNDPFGYMKTIHSLLKPGATCIIALPNCSSYDASHYREFWAAWDVPRHLWHFNPDSFRVFCERTGFKVKQIKKLPLDVFYISILSEKYRKAGLPVVKGILRGKIYWWLSMFRKERASSLIYILKKK